VRIAIPDLISNSYFPAIAAVELGCFQAEGLDAEIELVFPVTRAVAGLRDGAYDFVAGTASATLSAFPEWRGARLLAALAQHMYWFLVLRTDLKAQRGDIGALRGRRIGAAPGVDIGLRGLLRAAGIDPEREHIQIAPVPGSEGAGVSFGVTAAQALTDRKIDGFWANGMGAEVAVRRGIGTVVLDVRRGDGPPAARDFTFPALIATERRIEHEPESIDAAVRALIAAQAALREDPSRATAIGERLFPPMEAAIIAELIRRDLPYYDATISKESVERLNEFARAEGLLSRTVPYDQVVATRCIPLWIPRRAN
jgi:NitT/TauT family transport system substrate-binding protein